MPRFLTLPVFKPGSDRSTSLSEKNLGQFNEELVAQKVKELDAALAASNEKYRVLAAENDDMRRRLAAVSAANGTDESESLASQVPEPSSDETGEDVQNYSTW